MGVLPAASKACLPPCLQPLFDENSEIGDFYPRDFATDMNGKRFAWQAVTLLPFIDEARLLSAIAKREDKMTKEERRRNQFRLEVVYNRIDTSYGQLVVESLGDVDEHVGVEERLTIRVPLDPPQCNYMCGALAPPYGEVQPARLRAPFGLGESVDPNYVVASTFLLPEHQAHLQDIMEGTILPR